MCTCKLSKCTIRSIFFTLRCYSSYFYLLALSLNQIEIWKIQHNQCRLMPAGYIFFGSWFAVYTYYYFLLYIDGRFCDFRLNWMQCRWTQPHTSKRPVVSQKNSGLGALGLTLMKSKGRFLNCLYLRQKFEVFMPNWSVFVLMHYYMTSDIYSVFYQAALDSLFVLYCT